MKTITIFNYIRDNKDFNRILEKRIIRVVNVHSSFQGIGTKGEIYRAEFAKLVQDLEPGSDNFSVS